MSSPGVGFLELVMPDFGKITGGGVESVTPILWFVICGLAIFAVSYAARRARRAVALVDESLALMEGLSADDFWARRGAVYERSQTASREVASAWREYDETLVTDGRRVFGSLPAEAFFNEQRFASQLIGNRFLSIAPTALTTLGLLGTFLGLTVGLRGLNLGSTPDELRTGIQTLVNGAALGFTASLWGVFMSLLTNFHHRYEERRVQAHIRRLQSRIDALLPVRSPEQSLSDIARDSSASKEALQVLHEKIGSALQESVHTVGERTSAAVSEAIHESLTPIMRDLAQRATDQSAEVFRKVSDQLTESFREMGASLAQELKASSEAMRGTIDHMGEQLARHADEHLVRLDSLQSAAAEQARLVQETSAKALEDLQRATGAHLEDLRSTTTHQMHELQSAATAQMHRVNDATERQVSMLDESLPKVIGGLEQAAAVVGAATNGMESISENLSRVATEVGGTSTTLATILSDAIGAMSELADQTADAASSITNQQDAVADLTRRTTAAVDVLQQVAAALNGGFQGMTSVQRAFLDDLERQLTKHTQLMAGWMSSYADEVSKQTEYRMGEWNAQTERFTSTMLTATRGLSDAIDELDGVKAGLSQHLVEGSPVG